MPSISNLGLDEFNINSTKSKFNPYHIPRNSINNKQNNQKPLFFNLIILTDGIETPKIPRNITSLNQSGYVKTVCFSNNSDDGIKKTIEDLWPFLKSRDWRFFRCTSTSDLGIALKSMAGNRKKLYIGTIDGPIQTSSTTPSLSTSSSLSSTSSTSTSSTSTLSTSLLSTSTSTTLTPLSSTLDFNSLLDMLSQLENIEETYDVISNDNDLNNLDLDYFPLETNSRNVKKFLNKFLSENQKDLESKMITLHFSYNNNTEELYFWAKYATVDDLLKNPSISYLEESVIDIGGAFQDLTQRFWDFVRQNKLENAIKSGTIFEQINNNKRYLISYNPTAIHSKVLYTIGKLLFWTLIHNGFWPYWLDPIHFQFMLNENASAISSTDIKSICSEINPTVGRVISNLDNNTADYTIDKAYLDEPYFKEFLINNDIQIYALKNISSISNFLADLVVFGKRKEMIQELKNGFNQCDIIDKMKSSSFEWREFEQFLYKIATSTKDLLDQFDSNIPKENTTEYQFYILLVDYLKSLKEINDIHNVLKFITGGIQIPVIPKIKVKFINLRSDPNSADTFIHEASRLPKAYTCFNQLNLCINYDLTTESKQFVLDLNNAFSQCFVGFNENALHEDYIKTFNKPMENEEECII